MSESRFNFVNSTIGDGNVFGDNSSSNVQIIGREAFQAQLEETRQAANEAGLDNLTREMVLQQIEIVDAEIEKPQPDASIIQRCIEKAREGASTAIGKAAVEVALLPALMQLMHLAHAWLK